MSNVIWIWLGVVISLLLIEYMSKNFTAICFAISGMITCILTRFQDKYNIQLAVFLIGGIFLILVVRPFVLKKIERIKEEKQLLLKKTGKKNKQIKGKHK